MNAMNYRPWGQIDWLLGKLDYGKWSLLGCLGTEDRSVALACKLGRPRFEHATMVCIEDPDPLDPLAFSNRLKQRQKQLVESGFDEAEIFNQVLLSSLVEIEGHVTALAERGATALIIDITSLPKMWFFGFLKAALAEKRFTDLIVTYTSAAQYAEQLSENASPLRVLPGFFAEDGRTRHNSFIIGIGFEPQSLVPLLTDQVSDRIRLIFPFPPGPPGHRRNWMFVKQIEDYTQSSGIELDRVHIHMYDCSQIFDALREMTDEGRQTSVFAPYGPKTVSLAMCLFALAAEKAGRPRVPVYYAQPQRYAIDYTTEVSFEGDLIGAKGYCLRLHGRDLYSLQPD